MCDNIKIYGIIMNSYIENFKYDFRFRGLKAVGRPLDPLERLWSPSCRPLDPSQRASGPPLFMAVYAFFSDETRKPLKLKLKSEKIIFGCFEKPLLSSDILTFIVRKGEILCISKQNMP